MVKSGSAGRFGARYGLTIRQKVAKIEAKQRRKQKCPFCNKIKVKRLSYGIWHCLKCLKTFTSKAYEVP